MSVLGLEALASYTEYPRPPDPVAVLRQFSLKQIQRGRDDLRNAWGELGIQNRLTGIGLPGELETVFSRYKNAPLSTIEKACSDQHLGSQVKLAIQVFGLIEMAERDFHRDDLASVWDKLNLANFALGLMYGRRGDGRNARLSARELAMLRHRETADFRRIVIEYYQANRDRFPKHGGRPNKNAAAREIDEKGLVDVEYETIRRYLRDAD